MPDCAVRVAPDSDVVHGSPMCKVGAASEDMFMHRHIDIYKHGRNDDLGLVHLQMSVLPSANCKPHTALRCSKSRPQDHPVLPLQVIYLVRDVWRGLSAKGSGIVLPGGDKGFQRSLKDLTLTR